MIAKIEAHEVYLKALIGSRVLSGLVEQSLYNWLPKEHLP